MQRLSRITFTFAILFTLLIIMPGLLSGQFGPYTLIKVGDVLDLFSPLLLLPFYWLMLQLAPGKLPRPAEMIVFMVLIGAWASGQGMHLAANSIGHLLQDSMGADINDLVYFYDERISHIIWHLAIMGLSALLMVRQLKQPADETGFNSGLIVGGGFLYGLTFALASLEGQTAWIGLPFALLVTVFTLVWARETVRRGPVLTFFFSAYLLAAIFMVVWMIIFGGPREPYDVIALLP